MTPVALSISRFCPICGYATIFWRSEEGYTCSKCGHLKIYEPRGAE